MPIHDYRCEDCERSFEELVRGDEAVACPGCRGTRVRRLLSVFAVAGGDRPAAAPAGPCGSCGDPRGPGSCRLD